MKLHKDKNGYININLYLEKKPKRHLIHRIVAVAFIPNPENKPQVNHKDGNKENNNINNLEWNTCSENTQHSYDTGLKQKGNIHHNSKITEAQVLEIRESKMMQKDLAIKYKISAAQVSNIIKKKKWTYL